MKQKLRRGSAQVGNFKFNLNLGQQETLIEEKESWFSESSLSELSRAWETRRMSQLTNNNFMRMDNIRLGAFNNEVIEENEDEYLRRKSKVKDEVKDPKSIFNAIIKSFETKDFSIWEESFNKKEEKPKSQGNFFS